MPTTSPEAAIAEASRSNGSAGSDMVSRPFAGAPSLLECVHSLVGDEGIATAGAGPKFAGGKEHIVADGKRASRDCPG